MDKNLFTNDIKDYGEIAIDNSVEIFLNSPILKDIPIIKSILAIKNTYYSIKERLFFNKLYYFLKEINCIPREDRIIFFQKNSEKINKLEEKIFFYIENMETSKKTIFLSNLFKNLILEKITLEEFNRFSFIINSLSLSDIDLFLKENSEVFTGDLGFILNSKGIVTSNGFTYAELEGNFSSDILEAREHILTPLGKKLKKYIFN